MNIYLQFIQFISITAGKVSIKEENFRIDLLWTLDVAFIQYESETLVKQKTCEGLIPSIKSSWYLFSCVTSLIEVQVRRWLYSSHTQCPSPIPTVVCVCVCLWSLVQPFKHLEYKALKTVSKRVNKTAPWSRHWDEVQRPLHLPVCLLTLNVTNHHKNTDLKNKNAGTYIWPLNNNVETCACIQVPLLGSPWLPQQHLFSHMLEWTMLR